jgi:PAS domain S-box-containing protein
MNDKSNDSLAYQQEIDKLEAKIKLLQSEIESFNEKCLFYEALHNSAGLAIGFYDLDQRIISYNDLALQNMQGKMEDFVGKTFHDIFPKDNADVYVERFNKSIASANPMEYVDEIDLPIGKVWFKSTFKKVFTKKGKPIGVQIISSDITEQKKTEILLRESEKQYHVLSNSTFEAIFISKKGICMNQNQSAEEMFGYTLSEAIGKPAIDWIDKADHQTVINNIKSGNEEVYEVTGVRKDGSKFPCEIQARMLVIDGEQIRTTAVRDITSRNEVLQELKLNKERFDATIDATRDGLFDWNLITNEIYYSPNWKKMLGYQDHELANDFSTWEKLTHPDDVKESWTMLNKHIQGELERFDMRFKMQHKDGHWVNIYSRASAIFDSEGKATRVIGTHVDLTESIKAQEAIKQSEEKYKAMYLNAPLAYQSLNIDGYIRDVNPAWLNHLGYEREEVIGKWFGDFLKPDYVKVFKRNFPIFKAKGNISGVQFYLRKKDGEYIRVSFEGCIGYDHEGNFQQTYCTFKDITEEYKAKQQLIIAKEKAEESDKLKSSFLANMSHEIRTPMNGILGFANLLNKPQLTPEKKEKYIQIIQASGFRMLNIINDLIDISKIESNQMKISISRVNLNDQIDYQYAFFKREAEEKGLELIPESSLPYENAFMQTDKEKLYAMLTNLIKNAIKFTESGSITYGYKIKNENAHFYVQDTGIGILKEKQDVVFRRFIQADTTNTKAYEGAGLGLSITKGFCDMLGGKIWLESEYGVGSTFHFTLPFVNTESEEIDEPEKSILICDDDPTATIFLSELLNDRFSQVFVASNGFEAIQITEEQELDLILLDIKMPILDGFETLIEIRKLNSKVPVIAQTAFALDGDKKKVLNAGFNAYVSKPINPKELHKTILELFN